jgi:uncharacterized protein (DUF3084 family)
MDYIGMAEMMADRYGVDRNIFVRLIMKESNFNPDAVSEKGAVGLAQIMPKAAKNPGYGVKPIADRTDPETSLEYAAQYMRAMLDKFGNDYSLALAAYNAGPGKVQKYGGIPPFKETRDYVAKIMGGTGGTGEYDVTPTDMPAQPDLEFPERVAPEVQEAAPEEQSVYGRLKDLLGFTAQEEAAANAATAAEDLMGAQPQAVQPAEAGPEFFMSPEYMRKLPVNFAEGGEVGAPVAAPRTATIAGQYHKLAYINDDEEALLRSYGGSGIAGPSGIPAFPPVNEGGSVGTSFDKSSSDDFGDGDHRGERDDNFTNTWSNYTGPTGNSDAAEDWRNNFPNYGPPSTSSPTTGGGSGNAGPKTVEIDTPAGIKTVTLGDSYLSGSASGTSYDIDMYDVRSMYGVNADSDLTTDMVNVLNAAGKTGYSVGDKADMSVLETLQYAGYSTPDGSTLVSRPSVTTVGEPLTPNSPGLKDYMTAFVNGVADTFASGFQGLSATDKAIMNAAISRFTENIMKAGVQVTTLQDTIKLHGVDSSISWSAAAELRVLQEFINDSTEQLAFTAKQNGFKVGEDFWGQIGKSIQTASRNLVGVNNKEFDDDFGIKLAAGLGSALAFASVGLATGGLTAGSAAMATVATAIAGAVTNAGTAYDRAIKNGATVEQALLTSNLSLISGSLEGVPFGKALNVSRAFSALPPNLKQYVTGKLATFAANMTDNTVVEGFQEGLTEFLNNAIARGVYDEKTGLWANVGESALIGAIVGGPTMSGVQSVFGTAADIAAGVKEIAKTKLGHHPPVNDFVNVKTVNTPEGGVKYDLVSGTGTVVSSFDNPADADSVATSMNTASAGLSGRENYTTGAIDIGTDRLVVRDSKGNVVQSFDNPADADAFTRRLNTYVANTGKGFVAGEGTGPYDAKTMGLTVEPVEAGPSGEQTRFEVRDSEGNTVFRTANQGQAGDFAAGINNYIKETTEGSLATDLRSDLQKAQDQLKTARGNLKTARADLKTANSTIEKKTEALTKAEADLTAANTRYEELNTNYNTTKGKLDTATKDLADVRADLKTKTGDVSKLEEQNKTLTETKKSLEKQVTTLEGKVTDAEKRVTTVTSQRDKFKEQLDTAVAQRDTIKADFDTLRSNYDIAVGRLTASQANFTASQADLKTTQDTLKTTQGDLETTQANLKTAQSDLTAANSTIEEKTAAITKAEADLTAANKRYDELDTNYNTTQGKLETATKDLSDVRADLKTKTEELTQAKTDLAASQGDNKTLQEKVTSLESDVSKLEEQNKTLTETTESLEKQVTTLEGKVTAAEEQVTTVTSQRDTFKEQLDTAIAQRDTAKEEVSTLTAQNKTLTDNLKTAQGELKTTQGALETTQGELKTAQDTLKTTQGALETTQGELKTAQDALKTTQGDLETTQGELKTTQDTLKTTQADLKTAQDILKTTREALSDAQTELKTKTEELTQAKTDLAASQGDNKTLTDKVTALEGDVSTLEAEVTALEGDVSTP